MMRRLGYAALTLFFVTTMACSDEDAEADAVVVEPDAGAAQTDTDLSADAVAQDDAIDETPDAADEPDDEWPEYVADHDPTNRPGGDRPARVLLPDGYDPDEEWPMVVLLHGLGGTGATQDSYLGLSARRHELGFVMVIPEGTTSSQGQQFWNATSFCCDFEGSGVDDEGYLNDLVGEVAGRFAIDRKRIYFIGHSNGAFMSHRMAFAHGNRIAGVASLAGTMIWNTDQWPDTGPVALLHIHGDADAVVTYDGIRRLVPGAMDTATFWAGRNGCDDEPVAQDPIELVPSLAGAETSVLQWQGCLESASTELWTIADGEHIPPFSANFSAGVLEFLLRHRKP